MFDAYVEDILVQRIWRPDIHNRSQNDDCSRNGFLAVSHEHSWTSWVAQFMVGVKEFEGRKSTTELKKDGCSCNFFCRLPWAFFNILSYIVYGWPQQVITAKHCLSPRQTLLFQTFFCSNGHIVDQLSQHWCPATLWRQRLCLVLHHAMTWVVGWGVAKFQASKVDS